MPVPPLADPPPNSAVVAPTLANPQGHPSQKTMTKAERRELQERQRAAKAALKAQQQQSGGGGLSKPPKTLTTAPKKAQAGETVKQTAATTKEAAAAIYEATGGKAVSRNLRIFSHFGLPKPVSHVKGDIHPAIIRLGLLFSEFKVCGANARCIATLTAFKTVRLNHLPTFLD